MFYSVCQNKKEWANTRELDTEVYEKLPDTENFLTELTMRNEVLVVLSKIPESARRVLTLQFLEGKTQEEIARLEKSSVPAIKTRIHRAKKLFKELFIYESK
jgi:DNA-directed RNA polymerase specialized sigma24 family protein